MRLEIVRIVFRKELRELLRDRRSLMVMFGLPLVLYPLLTFAIAAVGRNREDELRDRITRVAVVNLDGAPQLRKLLTTPENRIELRASTQPGEDLASTKLDAVLRLPPDLEQQALAGQNPESTAQVDLSRSEGPMVVDRLGTLWHAYEDWIIQQRLQRELKDPAQARAVVSHLSIHTQDVSREEQRLGKMLAFMLPLLLMMTGMLGALFPALNATTTERELGTLETLLVTPASRTELLVAKGAIVLLTGLLTAALNMLSMSLVLWRTLSVIRPDLHGLAVRPGQLLLMLLLAYVAAVPSLIFFTTIVLIVGLFARNFREANAFATPVMMLPMFSVLVNIAEPQATTALLITPVVSTTLIIRDILTERATAMPFFFAFMSSCLYAAIMLSVATRVFTNEQLVNPAWEPVSFRLTGRKRGLARPRRLPAADEALALFCVSGVLTFYLALSAAHWPVIPQLVATPLVVVAGPALLVAYLGRYRWRETFAFRSALPTEFLGALLLGLGLAPVAQVLAHLQRFLWPPDDQFTRQYAEYLINAVAQHPILVPLLTAGLAGVCEELLYRGPLQTAFVRRISPRLALAFVALLFAVAHLDAHGIPLRFAIGLVLGWMVYRFGSIFLAMVTHAAFDYIQLFFLSQAVQKDGAAQVLIESVHPKPLQFSDSLQVGLGLLAMGLGLALLIRGHQRRRARSVAS